MPNKKLVINDSYIIYTFAFVRFWAFHTGTNIEKLSMEKHWEEVYSYLEVYCISQDMLPKDLGVEPTLRRFVKNRKAFIKLKAVKECMQKDNFETSCEECYKLIEHVLDFWVKKTKVPGEANSNSPANVVEPEVIEPSTLTSPGTPFTNRVNGAYVVAATNTVWSLDQTTREGVYLVTIIDLASRRVLNNIITDSPITGGVVCELLIQTFGRYDVPTIIHTDNGSEFNNEQVKALLDRYNITQSLVEAQITPNGNQVHESYHGRLWGILDCWRTDEVGLAVWELIPQKLKIELLNSAIKIINNTPLKTHYFLSPDYIDNALRKCPEMSKLKARKGSKAAEKIYAYKEYFILKASLLEKTEPLRDAGLTDVVEEINALVVSVNPELASTAELVKANSNLSNLLALIANRIKAEAENVKAFLEEKLEAQAKLLEETKKELDKIKDDLAWQRKLNEEILAEKQKKQTRREQRAKQKRLTPREAVIPSDIFAILDCVVSKDPEVRAFDRVALVVLCLTGMRISNLRLITISSLKAFFDKKTLTVIQIKDSQNSVMSFPWIKAFNPFLDAVAADLELIKNRRSGDDLVWSVCRETLTRRLNKTLRKASVQLGKHIRSHSFRKGVATLATEKKGIAAAKALLYHKSITSTTRYIPGGLTQKGKKELYSLMYNDEGGGFEETSEE